MLLEAMICHFCPRSERPEVMPEWQKILESTICYIESPTPVSIFQLGTPLAYGQMWEKCETFVINRV